MTTYSEFYGLGYETSSGPLVIVDVHEADIWPIADNSISTTKDAIAAGLHPVVAVGGRTAADGRPLNVTGVVISFSAGLTTATGRVRLNIADGYIVKNYVSNIKEYGAIDWETAPVIGQPVYVDDSALGEGCTLSLSPLNSAGLRNPQAGVLWYDQDEYIDGAQSGSRLAADYVWPMTWDGTENFEYLVCILLANGWRELA